MKLSEIHPYGQNAKKHPEKQVKQIADSIVAFGFNQPIVVDKNNEIIVGHGRYYAAKSLGLEDVPVIKIENLTDDQVAAYRIADNKLNESDWDMGLVIEELRYLDSQGIDITLTGFDKDIILEPEDKDDQVPEDAPAVAKPGDVWQLGPHRLLCGDATKPEDVALLMGEAKADMVFTDPPYNINYKGTGQNTSNTIEGDNVDYKEFSIFLDKVFKNYSNHTKSSAGVYVFHAARTQNQFEQAMNDNGYEVKNQLIWNKPAAGMGWGDYRWKHEPFFYAGKKGSSTQFYGDRTHTTIWDFQKSEQQLLNWAKKQKRLEAEGKTTIWSMKRDSVSEYVHPTQKPVELITHALTNSSKAEDIIMDLFGGSGSTLIAADKTNRIAYLMELDPKYCDIIIKRYEEYTGNQAKKVSG